MIAGFTPEQIDIATTVATNIIELDIGAKKQITYEKEWFESGDNEYFDSFYNYHKCITKALFALLF